MTREEAVALLAGYRDQIDEIDRRLLDLLNERTSVVENIGRVKREAKLPIYEPKREDEVYRNVVAHNRGPLTEDAVRRIFERVIDEMRIIQRMRMEQSAGGDK